MAKKTLISADSHVAEPPHLFDKYMDPAFRDRAPYLQYDEKRGDTYLIPGHSVPVPLGLLCAAGKNPREVKVGGLRFDELYPGSHNAKARIADQDRDNVLGEVVYPSLGMVVASHDDSEYKRACFMAYNRWLAEDFAGQAPGRIFGVGQLVISEDVERVIRDARVIKDSGLVGAMLPGEPENYTERDYDDSVYDPIWEALADLRLPISFHVHTSRNNKLSKNMARGSHMKLMGYQQTVRLNQDLISLFTFGGVFERHPRLKMVSVEADAGWLPHQLFRMDHAYRHLRFWMKADELPKMPSEYVRENVYTTFQDDYTAFLFKDQMNVRRLLWANDFPHSDATWPNSQALVDTMTSQMSEDDRNLIVHDNVVELYGLKLAA